MTFTTFSRPIRKVKAEVLGLDVHKRTIAWCRLDRAGRIVGEGEIPADRKAFDELLDEQVGRRKTHVTLEASGCFLWAHDRLVERLGPERVHVAQARRIAMIAESRHKTDRTDAFWLAYFTHEGRLPESWVPDGARRELRLAARYRHEAVAEQTVCVVRIRSDLAQLGIPIVGAGLRTPRALEKAWAEAERATGMRGVALRERLGRLEKIRARIAQWAERVETLSRDLPEVEAVKSHIPGIGPTLGALVVAESGEIRRFRSAKAYAAFTGLVPGTRISGGRGAPATISREGSALLRYALTQAAMACLRARQGPGLVVGDWIRRKELRMGAKGKARCAAARKLAECIWRLFHYGECFDPARAFGGRKDRTA